VSPSDLNPISTDVVLERYLDVRQQTEILCRPLEIEDYVIQTMADVSPTKWHLAHVSWFFETFVLGPHASDYSPYHPDYHYLFNSYYVSAGERHARPQRGFISRPTVTQIFAYRAAVDNAICQLISLADAKLAATIAPLIELGLHHEQQHQELLLMDIKHVLSCNPTRPAYRDDLKSSAGASLPLNWHSFPGGIQEIGQPTERHGFCYDNETPRHRVFLNPWELGDRLVTNADFAQFIADGGYQNAKLWLSDGWDYVQENNWQAPLYWQGERNDWQEFTLGGLQPLNANAPVCHISLYEADAYASWASEQGGDWAGARLPTEVEWEIAASDHHNDQTVKGNFVGKDHLQPQPAAQEAGLKQLFGDAWEFTASPYTPYPGFKPLAGTLGEYNGKFMASQFVLRGGACVTPANHIRASYRNFYYPHMRWQFGGLRLARDN